ncbi:hypothetical protein JZC00_004142 [Salmonella enterica subsp. enterica serovar 4,[5],12:i:-]|nr:hypothetical protein [Salmonella enterica subsp. enterica serovar 4,[5],12:i:-]EJE3952931.1 hypothetical protein [Escherichia coli]
MIWQPEFTDKTLSRKPGAVQFLVIAILCGVATFCVSGLYLKSLCLSVACCCGVFSRIFNYYSVPEESRMVLSRQELLRLMRLTEDVPDVRQELLNRLLSGKKLTGRDEQDIRRLWQETQRKHYA